jgi:hypothetical protein
MGLFADPSKARESFHRHPIKRLTPGYYEFVKRVISCVDTHTHYYPCYGAEAFLNRLHSNLLAVGRKFSSQDQINPVACLLDSKSSNGFADLSRGHLGAFTALSWDIEADAANDSVLHLTRGAERLTIISGRQVVTEEQLELILIGRTRPLAEGRPIKELLQQYQTQYSTILPWGFGKWLGNRGAIVDQLITSGDLLFSLGDNAGRPEIWRNVKQFELARQHSVPILPGTDPLPITSEQGAAGASAICLSGALDEENPVEDLARKIRSPGSWLGSEQQTSGLWRAFTRQVAMQIPAR